MRKAAHWMEATLVGFKLMMDIEWPGDAGVGTKKMNKVMDCLCPLTV